MAKTNKATVVTVEVLQELSLDEERERHRLELRVDKGMRSFYQVGAALEELRSRRLYRDTHPDDFVGYCRERFGKSKQAVNYLIAAAQVYENLATTNGCREDDQGQTTTIGCRKDDVDTTAKSLILPTNSRQVRHLAGFEPDEQRLIWQQAVAEVGGKVPSSRIVTGVVERHKQKPRSKASDFCNLGDVFLLTKLEGAERKYNGCWAIASDTSGITVGVDVHDGTLRVNPKNLKRIDSPEIHRSLPAIHSRIKRLRKCGKLDRSAELMLSHFGKQTYLSEVEEKIFFCLEQHYGVLEFN